MDRLYCKAYAFEIVLNRRFYYLPKGRFFHYGHSYDYHFEPNSLFKDIHGSLDGLKPFELSMPAVITE
jgi:hypothetical protein